MKKITIFLAGLLLLTNSLIISTTSLEHKNEILKIMETIGIKRNGVEFYTLDNIQTLEAHISNLKNEQETWNEKSIVEKAKIIIGKYSNTLKFGALIGGIGSFYAMHYAVGGIGTFYAKHYARLSDDKINEIKIRLDQNTPIVTAIMALLAASLCMILYDICTIERAVGNIEKCEEVLEDYKRIERLTPQE